MMQPQRPPESYWFKQNCMIRNKTFSNKQQGVMELQGVMEQQGVKGPLGVRELQGVREQQGVRDLQGVV